MRQGKSRVTKWTVEQIQEFRSWHETRIVELYAADMQVQEEIRNDREQWFVMVMP